MPAFWPTGRPLVDPSTRSELDLYRFAWGFYLLLAIGGLVWIGVRDGGIGMALFWRTASFGPDLLLGVAGGILGIGLWQLARVLLPLAAELERQLAEVVGSLPPSEVVALALLSGVGEELFFRGAMQPSWGLWPTAVIFAVVHSGRGRALLLWSGFALLAGLGLGALYSWRDALLAPIVAHVTINLVGLARLSRTGRDGSG